MESESTPPAKRASAPATALGPSDGRKGAAGRPRAQPPDIPDSDEELLPLCGDDPILLLLWRSFWRCPCDEHRNLLVEAHQQLVRDVVRRFAFRLPKLVDRGDLEIAANMGLMGAVVSFDPGRGVRFSSYGERRIKGALLDELRTQDWLPRPWRHKIELQKRTVARLRAERGREAHDEEVASALEMPLEEYQQIFGTGFPPPPTGSMPGEERAEELPQTVEVVEDPRGAAPGERPTREELLRLVAQKLTDVEYRIVYLKYWEELSMREIGQLTGLSESRVCKIHLRLLERLRDRLRVNAAD